jgi:hypothetical protein
MRVWLAVPVLAMAAGHLSAQGLLHPGRRTDEQIRKVFDDVWNRRVADKEVSCTVRSFSPRLDFGLNLWTGWQAEFPVEAKSLEEGQRLVSVFRVRPEGAAEAFYFADVDRLPKTPPDLKAQQKLVATVGGGIRVGPGKYVVEWVLAHPASGVCRKSWKFHAKAPRGVQTTLPPGQAAEPVFNSWQGFPETASGKGLSATILIHATPMRWRRNVTRLSPWERGVLLGMLRAVLDRSPIRQARVVVFDLEQGRTLYETEALTRRGYQELARALAQADYGTVDYTTYQKGPQDWPYLAERLKQESLRSDRSEALIFLGPSTRFGNRPPPGFRELQDHLPDLYYLTFTAYQTTPQDHISQLVRRLDGKVISIYEPRDLAKAVARLSEELQRRPDRSN